MLLETAALHLPGVVFKSFTYRALNPMVVNRMVRICGFKDSDGMVTLWAEDTETRVVGMIAMLTV